MRSIKDIGLPLLVLSAILFPGLLQGQFLSNLDATKTDALFTTYAAPLGRSSYTMDQGYQFSWNDEDNGAEFISKDGLNFGLAFFKGVEPRFRLNEMYREPVVTVSYSDLVSYYYYPFRDIRVDVFFDVYSSQSAVADIRIKNEGAFTAEINIAPYLYFPAGDTVNDILHQAPFDFYSFSVMKTRDEWMKEHSIPLAEELQGFIAGDTRFDSTLSFVTCKSKPAQNIHDPFKKLKDQLIKNKRDVTAVKGLICSREFRIYPGDQFHFRMVFGLVDKKITHS